MWKIKQILILRIKLTWNLNFLKQIWLWKHYAVFINTLAELQYELSKFTEVKSFVNFQCPLKKRTQEWGSSCCWGRGVLITSCFAGTEYLPPAAKGKKLLIWAHIFSSWLAGSKRGWPSTAEQRRAGCFPQHCGWQREGERSLEVTVFLLATPTVTRLFWPHPSSQKQVSSAELTIQQL